MTSTPQARRAPAPFLFFLLILPYGTSFGFISVAFTYLATHSKQALTPEQALTIVAAVFLPHTFKLLWAPIVDQTLTKKAWYVISLLLTVVGTVAVAAMPLSPGRIPLITATVVVSQIGLTLMGMSCEAFMGLGVSDENKGKASGWYNAGSSFGIGVGGGVALWLAQHLPSAWMSGAVLGTLMLLCAVPLYFFDEPLREHAHSVVESVQELGRNLVSIFSTRNGIIAFLICLSPLSTGASSQLFPAVADHWHVSADVVALVTGIIGGLVTSAGSMAGGFMADRMSRKLLYACSGGSMAATAALLGVLPHVPIAYVVLTLVYSFFLGASYSAFTAFVLETIGKGAVATKYNIFAGAMNGAIIYMTRVLGKADSAWGANGALFTDAACTLGALILMMTLVTLVLRSPNAEAAQPSQPPVS
ncbi:MAG: MFS transporter [Archangium sp.]